MMESIYNYAELVIKVGGALGILGGMGLWLYKLNKNVHEILLEVKPNGGKSLKDTVSDIQQKVNVHSDLIHTMVHRQKWLMDKRPEAIFECDSQGNCTWVNEQYCQLLQHDINYFLNNGWKNGIYIEDREKIEIEWEKSIKDKRSSISRCRLINREGKIIHVQITAVRAENLGYIGHIEVLDDYDKKR